MNLESCTLEQLTAELAALDVQRLAIKERARQIQTLLTKRQAQADLEAWDRTPAGQRLARQRVTAGVAEVGVAGKSV